MYIFFLITNSASSFFFMNFLYKVLWLQFFVLYFFCKLILERFFHIFNFFFSSFLLYFSVVTSSDTTIKIVLRLFYSAIIFCLSK